MRSSGKAEGGKVRREGKRRSEGMIGEKERYKVERIHKGKKGR